MSSTILKQYKIYRLKKYAAEHNVDVLIASLHANIRYMTEFSCPGGTLLHRTQTYALLDLRNEREALILGYGEAAFAYECLNDFNYYCYGDFRYDWLENPSGLAKAVSELEHRTFTSAEAALEQAIRDCSLQKGRIGLDESLTTIQIWQRLQKNFPQYEFVPAAEIFNWARRIKHPEEVHCLEKAAEIAEQAIIRTVNDLRIGMTEKEIEARYVQAVYALGGSPFFCIAAVDQRSATVDTVNTGLQLTDKSHIRFDLGCDYMGYKSDISRTVALCRCDPKIKEMYNWIREGEVAAIAAMKPGVSCESIFNIAVETVNKGIPSFRRHHCGHGIGLEIYDSPTIAPGVKDELEENMVFCIETPYYILGWGGIQVEDTVQVSSDGIYSLTKTANDLIEVSI